MTTILFPYQISLGEAEKILARLSGGEKISIEERLEIIREILTFSPRDWSTDNELWILYQIVMNESGERNEDYICAGCGGTLIVTEEKENKRRIFNCAKCHNNKLLECIICHKPRSVWADNSDICAVCALKWVEGVLTLCKEDIKKIKDWKVRM